MATKGESSSDGTSRGSHSSFYTSAIAEAKLLCAGEAEDRHYVGPDDTTQDNTALKLIVLKRKPLPMPYVPPIVFTDPEPFSKEVWCPSLVDRIEREYSTAAANYLYSIPRKRPALRDHSSCSIKHCTANDTDSENYQCFHWGKECPDEANCAFIGPNDQDVMNIIADDGIPLISIRESLADGLVIEVVRATFKSKFFAVSHVWSGGLGNPKGNQMPVCQIKRLYNLGVEINSSGWKKRSFAKLSPFTSMSRSLNKGKQESLLWIDTLCIPVNNWSLRWKAIDSMVRIYAAAQSIVIIDHELQQTPFKSLYRGSIFGRLFCSAWVSRCWTFQEGAIAREWLVQFEDGLCSIDKLFKTKPESLEEQLRETYPYPPPTPDEAVVSSAVVEWYRKMPRLQSGSKQYSFSNRLPTYAFLEIWNNLCLRTTTKKDDLMSIVAIMLDLRPSEVQEIPFEQRLLSIFHTQQKLPLGLLFRERDEINSWQQARCWLPSTIEERSVDQTECFMRRRSLEENFFVFECSNIQRFYLANVKMGNDRLLYLMDPKNSEALQVQFLLSDSFDLPSMNICIMMGDSLATIPKIDGDEIVGLSEFNRIHGIKEVTDKFGACLGVRNATENFVQFFYICPVKCVSDYTGIMREDIIWACVDDNPCLKHGMECVIEHGKRPSFDVFNALRCIIDFSRAQNLSQSRPLFTLKEWLDIKIALLALPYSIYILFCICYSFQDFQKLSSLWILYVITRGLLFFIEFNIVAQSLSQVEFDEWLTNLYRHNANAPYTTFYVHYPPIIAIGVSTLSSLIILLSWSIGNSRNTWRFVSRLAEVELGIIFLRWFLELYAQAPPKFNLLLALTSFGTSNQQIRGYYNTFYAPSRLTLYLQYLMQRVARLYRPRRIQLPLDIPEEDPEVGDSNPTQPLLEAGRAGEESNFPELVALSRDKGKKNRRGALEI
jgi:Heterokaryon incompatibility protein (HET)